MRRDIGNDNYVQIVPDNISILNNVLSNIENNKIDNDCFYICNLGELIRKHSKWIVGMPRVETFYALKCNPHPVVCQLLSSLGVNFDCASKAEMSQILELGVSANRIIYAHPCKQASHIRYADSHGINLMTFDSEHELIKIKENHLNAQLVLRIQTDVTKAICPLGLKFGAQMTKVPQILLLAKELEMNVVGVSFHVGSGCFDSSAYSAAIKQSYDVFQVARNIGFEMTLLDIGGGFPGEIDSPEQKELFEDVCNTVNYNIDTYFPPSSNIRIIAEPGRYYAASAFTLVCNVTSVREMSFGNEKEYYYYLNDGVYGSFNCTVFDHFSINQLKLINQQNSTHQFKSTLWGPTCDSADKIAEKVMLPRLEVGEWVYFEDMGAYTIAAASNFNGFQKGRVYLSMERTNWRLYRHLLIPEGSTCHLDEDSSDVFCSISAPLLHNAVF